METEAKLHTCKIVQSTRHVPKGLRHKLIHKKARVHVRRSTTKGKSACKEDKPLTHNPFSVLKEV